MSYGNIIGTVTCKIQLVEIILISLTEAAVVETTEAAASLASNVATALVICYQPCFMQVIQCLHQQHLAMFLTNFCLLFVFVCNSMERPGPGFQPSASDEACCQA